MKKNFKCLALMAAALLVGFSSCSNDNDAPSVDAKTPKNMKIKVNLGAPTGYAEGPAQTATAVNFASGDLYFTDGAGTIKKHYSIKSDAVKSEGDVIKLSDLTVQTGYTVKNLPGDAIYVYLVGNTANLPTTGNIKAVQDKSVNVGLQVATADNKNNVNLYGAGVAAEKTAATPETNAQYEVAINLAPTAARIELGSITATGDITGFQVDGIFVDYYYSEASVIGAVDDKNLVKNDDNIDNFLNTNKNYPTSLYDWITTPATTNVVKPTTDGNVWGYNVFAANAGSTVPRIVIRLSNVTAKTGSYTGSQFITVKGFNDKDGKPLGTIKPGNVYKLATGLTFKDEDVTIKPNMPNIDVKVTVTVDSWKIVEVGANLG